MRNSISRELTTGYTAAYVLLSKHFDFITRVVFTLLHFWWLGTFAIPFFQGDMHGVGVSALMGACITVFAAFVGALLMFFRENSVLINTHYAVTIVSLLNFIIIAASTPLLSSFYVGALTALVLIAATSHMQYTVKQASCLKTVQRMEEILNAQVVSDMSVLPAQEHHV